MAKSIDPKLFGYRLSFVVVAIVSPELPLDAFFSSCRSLRGARAGE